MKKIFRFAVAAGIMFGATLLTACGDDGKPDPEFPVTRLTLTGWNFSSDSHEDICIGEIKTKDTHPEINVSSTDPAIGVTYALMPDTDDGMYVYKILASMAERTVSTPVASTVEVEVVGKTNERTYKKVIVRQQGFPSGIDMSSLAGNYTLGIVKELDADDGDYEELTHGVSVNLNLDASGNATFSGISGTDDFSEGTFTYSIEGNKLRIGRDVYTVVSFQNMPGEKILVVEYPQMKGNIVDEYEQYTFMGK